MYEHPQANEGREKESYLLPENMIDLLSQRGLFEHQKAYEKVLDIANAIKENGGRALLVGGSVRDYLMGKISKDYDLEVYGLDDSKVEEIVIKFGEIKEVGKAFGIFKLPAGEGIDIDISLPRTDSKIGEGHSGFSVKTNPHMSIEEAAKRRDFTMNSVAADPLTGELFDPYGGAEDIRKRMLRVTDPERFKDDPLRVLRGLQFVGRFGLRIDEETGRIMQEMAPSLRELPKERLWEEWKKLLLKSTNPSRGLNAGMTLNIWEHIHPELPPLVETPQEGEWHPEGDVWIHTLMAVDIASGIIEREQLDEKTAIVVLLGALAHDFGKPATTELIEGRIKSYAHDQAGVEPAVNFMNSLGVDNLTQDKVKNITKDHLTPSMLYILEVIKKDTEISDGTIRRLAKRIHPATIQELVYVAESDHLGRGPFMDPETPDQYLLPDGFPAASWILEKARRLEVEMSKPADLIRGRELIAFGLEPGADFGKIIQLANELRDEKGMTREEVLALISSENNTENVIQKLSNILSSG